MNDPLNNLPPFFIGQKVVYITGINMPKDSVHTVSDIVQSDCGCWHLYINGDKRKLHKIKSGCIAVKCNNCNKIVPVNYKIYEDAWEPKSFRPLQEQSFPLITYSKVLKEVPVSAN